MTGGIIAGVGTSSPKLGATPWALTASAIGVGLGTSIPSPPVGSMLSSIVGGIAACDGTEGDTPSVSGGVTPVPESGAIAMSVGRGMAASVGALPPIAGIMSGAPVEGNTPTAVGSGDIILWSQADDMGWLPSMGGTLTSVTAGTVPFGKDSPLVSDTAAAGSLAVNAIGSALEDTDNEGGTPSH